jgi:hypothetical protein
MASTLLVDLLAYWKLDTDSWLDSSGNGYTLVDSGSTPATNGIGIILNGTTSSDVTYLTNTSVTVGSSYSVSIWVNPISFYSSVDCAWNLGGNDGPAGVVGEGQTYFFLGNNGGGDVNLPASAQVGIGDWTNICYVVDNTAQEQYFYINGVLQTTGTFAGDFGGWTSFILGAFPDRGLYSNDHLDEVGIWNRAITQQEVTNLYSLGIGNTYPFLQNQYSVLYYNNSEADGDWGNILNWWQDVGFTEQAIALPTITNPVNLYDQVTQNTQGVDQCFAASATFWSANFGAGLILESTGVVNMQGSSILAGTTLDGVSMHDSSTIAVTGEVLGNVVLRDGSTNQGLIQGNATVYYDGGSGTYPIGGTVVGTVTYIGFNLAQTCYFNNAVNTFLGEVGNWWQDSSYTIPTGFVPDATNDVVFGNGIIIEGITGAASESATYNSIFADGAGFNGSTYSFFTVTATNGIVANSSVFFACEINANGTYTDCRFSDNDYGSSIIGGNVSLYNSIAITTKDSDFPQVAGFTGNVNAYYPTAIASGNVQGTLTRYGYYLYNTCIAHCNLNETSGTRTVLDLYEEQGVSQVVLSGAGVIVVDGTYIRQNSTQNLENTNQLAAISYNGNEYQIDLGGGDYYFTTDFVDWFSTNSIYNPPPTTDSIVNGFPVGYGTGLIGNAAKFDYNSLVNPDPAGGNPFQLEVQFSISVWVNFPVVPSTPPQAIVGTGYDVYPNSLTINVENSNLGLFVDATPGGQITGPSISANTWHNCVVTCTTNAIKFYVDGVFQAQFATPLFYTAGVYLSKYLTGYQLTNNALVDEFNLFNLDLNQDQINQLYNGGAGSTFPFINYGTGYGTIDWARMLHLPFFFDSRKPSLARLLYLPWFINI